MKRPGFINVPISVARATNSFSSSPAECCHHVLDESESRIWDRLSGGPMPESPSDADALKTLLSKNLIEKIAPCN